MVADSSTTAGNNTGYWRDKETGFTYQWGRVFISGDTRQSTNFSIPFTQCFSVQVCNREQSNPTHYEQAQIAGVTNSSVTIMNETPDTMTAHYLAVGIT